MTAKKCLPFKLHLKKYNKCETVSFEITTSNLMLGFCVLMLCKKFVKGCVCYIFPSLCFKSKQEHLSNYEKCFLFHFKSSFCSGENQI